jgi:hypothetical protein
VGLATVAVGGGGVSVGSGVAVGGTDVAVGVVVAVLVGVGEAVKVGVGVGVSVGRGVAVASGVFVGVLVGRGVGVGGATATKQASSQKELLFLTGNSCQPLVYTVITSLCAVVVTVSGTQAS